MSEPQGFIRRLPFAILTIKGIAKTDPGGGPSSATRGVEICVGGGGGGVWVWVA